jgi:predicted amidohydrolase
MSGEKMRVAAFQFSGSDNIEANFLAIERGIIQASEQNVRFMITQECALCGYPPIETGKVAQIDYQQIEEAIDHISQLAIKHHMYIGLGTILPHQDSYTNSIVLISPHQDKQPAYHKRALWGWDLKNYTPGNVKGIHTIDNIKLGLRICYEVRFPEYFRELFREKVDIAFVSFCDVAQEPNTNRYELIKSHLITRAVENVMYVISVNSISNHQIAPTCVIDPDGVVLETAPLDKEYLLVFPYVRVEPNFGRNGRIQHSRELTS